MLHLIVKIYFLPNHHPITAPIMPTNRVLTTMSMSMEFKVYILVIAKKPKSYAALIRNPSVAPALAPASQVEILAHCTKM